MTRRLNKEADHAIVAVAGVAFLAVASSFAIPLVAATLAEGVEAAADNELDGENGWKSWMEKLGWL